MPAVIEMSNVSKCYQLGLTRRSIGTLAAGWFRQALGDGTHSKARNQVFWALKGVSFDLARGESLGLVGPNGAGKSTVLKVLARVTMPTAGTIAVRGKLAALIELGAGFHHDLTGRENVYLNGTLLGLSKAEIRRRFDEIVAFAELEQFIDTPLKRYSSGMTVRLGFAVASCIEPDILIVDEVLAVGDTSFRQKCVARIKNLQRNGTSLMLVAHDLGLVKTVCSNALYIEHGTVQARGSTADVIDAYNVALERRRAATLALDDYESSSGSGVEIVDVGFADSSGGQSREVYSDDAATICIRYTAYRSIGAANVVIQVVRSDGVQCFSVRTSTDRVAVRLEKGVGVFRLSLEPLQLFAGMYSARVWILDADDAIGLATAASDWIQVRSRIPGQKANAGVFEPIRQWTHEEGSPGRTVRSQGTR